MKTTVRVKVFVDTNVLVDYLSPSRKDHNSALDLFGLILTSQIEAALSTQSMLDASYIARKFPDFSQSGFRATMIELLARTNVEDIDSFDLKAALKDTETDLEDSAQIAFAYNQRCDVIITHDKKLLARTMPRPMLAMTPESFLDRCRA